MVNYAQDFIISNECYYRMMESKTRIIALPYEMEERCVLSDIINEIPQKSLCQMVVVGAANYSYFEIAKEYSMDYVAVDPTGYRYICNSPGCYRNSKYIPLDFGEFESEELKKKRTIFIFMFNVLAYIPNPIVQINRYINPQDIILISTWNNYNENAINIRSEYYDAVKLETAPSLIKCNISDFNCEQLKYFKFSKRITKQITDYLIIYC